MTDGQDLARRRRRREVLRTHHPDLGGDPDELIRALQTLDRVSGTVGDVTFFRSPRGLRRLSTWYRAHRHARRRPPRVR